VRTLRDKVCVITGAGSGIGRELAKCLAREGCELALNDNVSSKLEKTVGLVRAIAPLVTAHPFDIADRERVYRCAKDVAIAHGGVDILVNNAGVGLVETIEDVTYGDFEWLMGINFWGAVHCTKAFLPYLKQRPEAHIVNISSIDGVLPAPNNGPYSASKSAVIAFTETLLQELHGTQVRVSCVIPGGVKTDIHRNARFFKQACDSMSREQSIAWFEGAAATSASRAAMAIVEGIRKNRTRILIGPDARFIDLMTRLAPVGSLFGAGHIMRNLDKFRFDVFDRLRRRLKRLSD